MTHLADILPHLSAVWLRGFSRAWKQTFGGNDEGTTMLSILLPGLVKQNFGGKNDRGFRSWEVFSDYEVLSL